MGRVLGRDQEIATVDRTGSTVIEALVRSLEAAAKFNPNDVVHPYTVLWMDHDSQWQPIIEQLRRLLPQLVTFGDYEPEHRSGPAIWLRSVVDWALPEGELPEGVTPIVYLLGVSRQELRAVQECPDSLKALVGLQYRGVCSTQKNGKDWTVEAFLVSEEGGLGLEVVRDATTRPAMLRALPELATTSVDRLKYKHLEAEDFDKLFSDDPAKDLLLWLSEPEAVRTGWNGGRWAALRIASPRRMSCRSASLPSSKANRPTSSSGGNRLSVRLSDGSLISTMASDSTSDPLWLRTSPVLRKALASCGPS